MMRSVLIFSFFALATVMVIVFQPGPRPDYAYEQTEAVLNETSRNEVQVLRDPQPVPALSVPDDVINELKTSSKAVLRPDPLAGATSDALQNLQATLDASLAVEDLANDATDQTNVSALDQTPAQERPYVSSKTQAIAPELRDMSWQTLNALNTLSHKSKAPGQEGSLLNSIVRRSMGHVDGTQIVRPSAVAPRVNVEVTRDVQIQAPSNATQIKATQNYVVASGDTLALIAIKLYGSALATERLVAENPALRQNPNDLRIGQLLRYSVN